MKSYVLFALPLILVAAACTQEKESTIQSTRRVNVQEAMIQKGVQSLRIKSFYVPDPQNATTQQAVVPAERMTAFTKKSRLFHDEGLAKQSGRVINREYQAFVKANATDPRLGQFRWEAAEKLLAQTQVLSAGDKAYFTRELIAARSSNLTLMRESLVSLRGKIDPAEHTAMVRQATQLLDQYETYFKAEAAESKTQLATTYQERAVRALNARYAELALNLIRENRQLLVDNSE